MPPPTTATSHERSPSRSPRCQMDCVVKGEKFIIPGSGVDVNYKPTPYVATEDPFGRIGYIDQRNDIELVIYRESREELSQPDAHPRPFLGRRRVCIEAHLHHPAQDEGE